jgi:putative ABC transport system permease protein
VFRATPAAFHSLTSYGLLMEPRPGIPLAAASRAMGAPAAWGATRLVESFLLRMKRNDPLVLSVSVLLLAVGAYLPAWRASRIDPMAALRRE